MSNKVKKEMVSTSHGFTIYRPVTSAKMASKEQPNARTKSRTVTNSSSTNVKLKCTSQRAPGCGGVDSTTRHQMRTQLRRHFPQQQRQRQYHVQPSKATRTRQSPQSHECTHRLSFVGPTSGNSGRSGHRLGGASSPLLSSSGGTRHRPSSAQQRYAVRQAWTRVEVSPSAKST